MQLIQTIEVGSGGAASIEFTSIPQIYTDLKIVISCRAASNGGTVDSIQIKPNGSTSNLSSRWLIGDGSSVSSSSSGSIAYVVYGASGSTTTANTFGNVEIYITNYTSSNNKSISADGVAENNATTSGQSLNAGLWASSAAISSLTFTLNSSSNFTQYSTASLYGITKGSGGATAS